MKTQNFQLPLLIQSQAMKEYTINNAINKIDFLINKAAISFVNSIPLDAKCGDIYIIKNAIDELIERENHLLICIDGVNEFITPCNYTIFYIQKMEAFYIFNDNIWAKIKYHN